MLPMSCFRLGSQVYSEDVENPGVEYHVLWRGDKSPSHMDVSKNRGILPPKMDGENNGHPYKNGMIWGEKPPFLETPI